VKVLIIDDDGDIRRIARLSLSRVGGHEVVDAADGPSGLERALAERPDVILLDVMMPGQDGPATLAALRANPDSAAIPVVFLTAKAMPEEIERLKRLGVNGVLNKPFDPMTLPMELVAALHRGGP
jgi:two-component system, OmpR family, response regulator